MSKTKMLMAGISGLAAASLFFMGATIVALVQGLGTFGQFLIATGIAGSFGYYVVKRGD